MAELTPDFIDLLLRFLVLDRHMLAAIADIVDVKDFEERPQRIVAMLAVHHYEETQEPIASWLRTEVEDYCESLKNPLPQDVERELKKLVNSILKRERPLTNAIKVQAYFIKFKHQQFFRRSFDELLELQLQNELTVETFATLARKCSEFTVTDKYKIRDYMHEVEQRIKRRQSEKAAKAPLFFIDPLDERIRNIRRKELFLWLAPYKSGKSMALAYTSVAHVRQHLKVLYLHGEDTESIVDGRLDAMLTDTPINELYELDSEEFRLMFERAKRRMRGSLKIVDFVGEDLSVEGIDSIWQKERSKGFTADVIVCDYDEKLAPPRRFKADSGAIRMETTETYQSILKFIGRRDLMFHTAAQGTRDSENKKIIDGSKTATDINKIRMVTCAIGIGTGDRGERNKYLYVAAHRDGYSRFGVDIMTDYAKGLFYDREATLRLMAANKKVDD